MSETELSDEVKNALNLIENKDMTYPQLMNLFNNTEKSTRITEIERELLTQKLESVMRINFPRETGNLLGNKNDKPIEILEEVYHTISNKYDLSDNLHKNGVKVGGDMIGGRAYIAWYISYKNRDNWGTSLAYRQKTADTDPRLEVRLYHKSLWDKDDERQNYRLADISEAVEHFSTCIELVM